MSVIIDGIHYVPQLKLGPVREWGTFGEALRRMRKATRRSLDKAAAEIGCSKSFLWELEHDRSEPGLRLAAKIAEVYGVPLLTLAMCLNEA